MIADLRAAGRALRNSPVFAIACVLSLAIGVGLNGTSFSLIDAVLRPPPYAEPNDIVVVQDSRRVPDYYLLSHDEYRTLQSISGFEVVAAYRLGMGFRHALRFDNGAAQALGFAVSADVFRVLGVRPILGRTLARGDERPDAPPVIVLGGNLWRRAFDADPGVLGSTVRIRGLQYEIVGVMPNDFWFPADAGEFWVPLSPASPGFAASERSLSVIGRVREGTPRATAVAQLEQAGGRLDESAAAAQGQRVRWWRIDSLADVLRPGDLRLLVILQLIAAAVLVLACINVSNLMLVRISLRRRESAIRASLGASRWQRVRPVVAEALLLGIATAVAGGMAAVLGMHFIASLFDRVILASMIASGTSHVLLVALLGAVLAVVLCTAAPLAEVFRTDARASLAYGTSAVGFGRRTQRMRQVAVGLQVGVSLALLASTAILIGGLKDVGGWTPGFPIDGLSTMPLGVQADGEEAHDDVAQIMARMEVTPGVTHIALSSAVFPEDGRIIADNGAELNTCTCFLVTSDFVATLGLPLRRGRAFERTDVGGEPVAIVDERLASRLWETSDALGRRLRLGSDAPWMTVVAVAAEFDMQRPDPALERAPAYGVYVLGSVDSIGGGTLMIRTASGGAGTPLPVLRRALHDASPDRRASTLVPMRESLESELRPMRAYTGAIGALASLALILAVVGLNGVLGYHVMARSHELAVRAALGAAPRALVATVAWDAARLVVAGTALGIFLAHAASRVLAHAVLGVEGTAVAFPLLASLVVMSLASVAATAGPALRAIRVPPAKVLRT